MDSLYLQDSLGNVLTPIWSKKESVLFCSVLAPLSSMASEILRYNNPAPLLLDPFTSETYHDREHWLGWVPTGEPPRSPYETEPALDLLEICFRQGPVPTMDNFYDTYDSDHQISPVERPAGCHLDPTWVEEVSYVDDRLHALSRSLAETSEFYCRGPPMNRVGDIPNPIDINKEDAWFQEEYLSAAEGEDSDAPEEDEERGRQAFNVNRDDSPFEASIDPVTTWVPKYRSSKEALTDLADWAPSVMEYDPKKPAYDPLSWNSDWLNKAYLIVDDPRTRARLKMLCALFPEELDHIQAVLEYAMRFGMPFELCTKMRDAGGFRNHQLSSLAMNTLPAVYDMGYVDQVMTWAGTSEAAQFGVYLGTIFQLLQKPNTIAFVAKGGVCKFVAELFATDLAYRFVRGPSEQVSEFGKGKTSRLMINGESTLCISDQVSDIEVAILLGHVKGKNSRPGAFPMAFPGPSRAA
ncbi:hypothetical protein B0H14DRAFT_3509278 [Mycena olivaceomarginata]|nr:hypothetical protein B0H14DRAFT_3509278 [Mycena olivaceomarginata]